jgi:hypothetical protein
MTSDPARMRSLAWLEGYLPELFEHEARRAPPLDVSSTGLPFLHDILAVHTSIAAHHTRSRR